MSNNLAKEIGFQENSLSINSVRMRVIHCSIPQEIAGDARDAIQKSLEDTTLALKIFCPSHQKRHLSKQEIARGCYWPEEKTADYITKKNDKTDIILASAPVVELIDNRLLFIQSKKTPTIRELSGETVCKQIASLPQKTLDALIARKIKVNQDIYKQQINQVMMEIVEHC